LLRVALVQALAAAEAAAAGLPRAKQEPCAAVWDALMGTPGARRPPPEAAFDGGGGADAEKGGGGGRGAEDDPLSRELRRARRAAGAARPRLCGDGELALACAAALLAHARPRRAAASGHLEDGEGDGGVAGAMHEWLRRGPPVLLRRLLAVTPGHALAADWQRALLAELSLAAAPAHGAGAGAAEAAAAPPAWLSGCSPATGQGRAAAAAVQLPAAPGLLAAALRSLAPERALPRGDGGGGGRGRGVPAEEEVRLRVPRDAASLARCGRDVTALLLQAVRGCGGCSDALSGGAGPPARALRAARLLARARVLRAAQEVLLEWPNIGVLLAALTWGHPAPDGGGACGCADAAAAALAPVPACRGVCAALRAAADAVAASGPGCWIPAEAARLMAPLQLLLAREQDRIEILAADALRRLVDGEREGPPERPAAAALQSEAGTKQQQQQEQQEQQAEEQQELREDGDEGEASEQREQRRQRGSQDASAYMVVWSAKKGAAAPPASGRGAAADAAATLGGGGAARAGAPHAAALRLLPGWLLEPPEPLAAAGACRLLSLASQQLGASAAAKGAPTGVGGREGAGPPEAAAGAAAAAAALSAAARCLASGEPSCGGAGALAAASYVLFEVGRFGAPSVYYPVGRGGMHVRHSFKPPGG
jgi:hypothetical protein